MCQFQHTSSSLRTCAGIVIFLHQISQLQDSLTWETQNYPYTADFEEKREKLGHPNYQSNVIELNTNWSDISYQYTKMFTYNSIKLHQSLLQKYY